MTTLVASVTKLTLVTAVTTTPMPAMVTLDNTVTLVTVFTSVTCKLWSLKCGIKAVPLRRFSTLFYSLLHKKQLLFIFTFLVT